MTLSPSDQRGIAAALAYSADHHPNADRPRLADLAERIGPDAGAYFRALRAGRCTCTTHRPTGPALPTSSTPWPAP